MKSVAGRNGSCRVVLMCGCAAMLLCLFGSCAKTLKYPQGSEWEKNSITSLATIRVNGLKHAVLIRGTNVSNPVLLFIHPMGVPSMCFAHLEYPQKSDSPIEKKFTVVHYDQRGFGKTYLHGRHKRRDVKLDNYICDAESLVVNLRSRFGNRKMYVLGESWGSQIGVRLVAKHPEWFYAYIGAGQNVKGADMLKAAHEFCRKEAVRDSNAEALADLRRYGPPQPSMNDKTLFKSMMTTGTWMDHYLAKVYQYNSDAGFFFKSLWEAPEYSFIDFEATLTAYLSTNKRIIREACFSDLQQAVTTLAVPVYMIMGEYDFWTPIAKKYLDTLQAPSKEWLVIKGAGHMVRGDNPDEFGRILVDRVLAETLR